LRPSDEQVSQLPVTNRNTHSFAKAAMVAACVSTVVTVCDATSAPNTKLSEPNQVFAPCSICHSVGPNAPVGVGPPLNGILGKRWATHPNFAYSAGMVAGRENGRLWDEATLNAWIEKPRSIIPDTKMMFPGLADAKARQAIIDYLRRFDEAGQAR
jgi:cytochrome c